MDKALYQMFYFYYHYYYPSLPICLADLRPSSSIDLCMYIPSFLARHILSISARIFYRSLSVYPTAFCPYILPVSARRILQVFICHHLLSGFAHLYNHHLLKWAREGSWGPEGRRASGPGKYSGLITFNLTLP